MSAQRQAHAVADLLWLGGRPAPGLDLFAQSNQAAPLAEAAGQFALHQVGLDGNHVLARDPLGVNKLFFALGPDGHVVSSNYWIDLVRAGFPATAVWSVPAGHLLTLSPRRRALALRRYAALSFCDDGAEAPSGAQVARIRARLGRRSA